MGDVITKLFTNGKPEGIPRRFIYKEDWSLPSHTDVSADRYETIQLDAESVSDQEVCNGPDESLCQPDQDEDADYTVLNNILSSSSGPRERSPCHVCPVHFSPLRKGLCDSNCTDNHRDKIIEFMVEVFKPLIVKRIDASEVVQYLDFIDSGMIRSIECPRKSVERLIGLIHRSNTPGKWMAFSNALLRAENPHIRGLVNTHTENDNFCQERLLKWHAPELARNMYIADILDKLEEEEVISVTDKEKVMAMNRQRGETHAAFFLLDLVPNRKEDWDSRFIKALRKCGMPEYASNLEEVMPLNTSHENALLEKQANETKVKTAPTRHPGNFYTPWPEGMLKATSKQSATRGEKIVPTEIPVRVFAQEEINRPVKSRDSSNVQRRSQEQLGGPQLLPSCSLQETKDTSHPFLESATEDKQVQTTGLSKNTLIKRWRIQATTKPSVAQKVVIAPPELPPRRYAKPDIYRPCVKSSDSTEVTRQSQEMPKFTPRCHETTHLVVQKDVKEASIVLPPASETTQKDVVCRRCRRNLQDDKIHDSKSISNETDSFDENDVQHCNEQQLYAFNWNDYDDTVVKRPHKQEKTSLQEEDDKEESIVSDLTRKDGDDKRNLQDDKIQGSRDFFGVCNSNIDSKSISKRTDDFAEDNIQQHYNEQQFYVFNWNDDTVVKRPHIQSFEQQEENNLDKTQVQSILNCAKEATESQQGQLNFLENKPLHEEKCNMLATCNEYQPLLFPYSNVRTVENMCPQEFSGDFQHQDKAVGEKKPYPQSCQPDNRPEEVFTNFQLVDGNDTQQRSFSTNFQPQASREQLDIENDEYTTTGNCTNTSETVRVAIPSTTHKGHDIILATERRQVLKRNGTFDNIISPKCAEVARKVESYVKKDTYLSTDIDYVPDAQNAQDLAMKEVANSNLSLQELMHELAQLKASLKETKKQNYKKIERPSMCGHTSQCHNQAQFPLIYVPKEQYNQVAPQCDTLEGPHFHRNGFQNIVGVSQKSPQGNMQIQFSNKHGFRYPGQEYRIQQSVPQINMQRHMQSSNPYGNISPFSGQDPLLGHHQFVPQNNMQYSHCYCNSIPFSSQDQQLRNQQLLPHNNMQGNTQFSNPYDNGTQISGQNPQLRNHQFVLQINMQGNTQFSNPNGSTTLFSGQDTQLRNQQFLPHNDMQGLIQFSNPYDIITLFFGPNPHLRN